MNPPRIVLWPVLPVSTLNRPTIAVNRAMGKSIPIFLLEDGSEIRFSDWSNGRGSGIILVVNAAQGITHGSADIRQFVHPMNLSVFFPTKKGPNPQERGSL